MKDPPKKTFDIALVGNPNVGKSTLFNKITGEDVHIGNWPGVTVDLKEGFFEHLGCRFRLVDLPGTYSLRPYSDEERVTLEFLLDNEPDMVLCMVDATSIENSLYIALQVIEMGFPTVIAVNKSDLIKGRDIHLDIHHMSSDLHCPVFPVVSTNGVGIDDLKDAIVHETHHHIRADIAHPLFHDRFEHDLEDDGENRFHRHRTPDHHLEKGTPADKISLKYGREIEGMISDIRKVLKKNRCTDEKRSRWYAISLLEGTKEILKTRMRHGCGDEIESNLSGINQERIELKIAAVRHEFIHDLLPDRRSRVEASRSDRIDRILTNRIVGPLVFLIAIFAMFNLTFRLGDPISGLVEILVGWLAGSISELTSGILESLLIDGILEGVGAVIIFFPYIFILYLIISVMEGSGYMARGAYLLDGFMARFKLPGRSFIPVIMGFGCSVPAILSTRTIPSKNDRIATALVIPFASCGARLPVYVLLAGLFFSEYAGIIIFLLYMLGIGVLLVSALVFKLTMLKGEPTPFIMDMPSYRIPSIGESLRNALRNTGEFLKKAGTVILVAMIFIWGISHFGPDGYLDESEKEFDGEIVTSSGKIDGMGVFTSRGEEFTFSGTISQNFTYDGNKTVEKGTYDDLELKLEQGKDFRGNGTLIGPVEFKGRGVYTGSDFIIEDSFSSTLGKGLEPVFRPLGFDWKIVVSLIFGTVAKEIVVGTLGVLFGSADDEEALSDSLENSDSFTPLISLELMVFVLLYIPCIPTLITQKKELGSWKWMGFSMLYTTVIAYTGALLVRLIGLAMGY